MYKRQAYGAVNRSLRFDGLNVEPGDLVVGDNDGVVVVPRARAVEVVEKSHRRDADEIAICERLMQGETTLDIYKLG